MCPSEVSDIESTIWQEYKSKGVVVWGIGSADTTAQLIRFRDQMGLTFPILFDENSTVFNQYGRLRAGFGTAYPQDWVIGKDGKVVYMNPGYEPEEIRAVLDAELAK